MSDLSQPKRASFVGARSWLLPAGLAVGLLAAVPLSAAAQTCVTISESRDNLSPEDRKAARMALLGAFEKEGVKVDYSGSSCSETYKLSNLKLGSSISVKVSGPKGTRQARAAGLDELTLTYSQIVKALLTGTKISAGGPAIDRTNATTDQMAPRRVTADSVKYIRLGYGVLVNAGDTNGPAFGLGYRYELDRFGIDISIFNLIVGQLDDKDNVGVTGSWIKLMGCYFFNSLGNNTPYLSAGLSWGATGFTRGSSVYAGTGLHGEVAVGYELLRASTIRAFVELSATLPFYVAKEEVALAGGERGSRYSPSFVLAIGLGWGRPPKVVRVAK